MSTQILLTVPDDVYHQAEKAAGATQRNIADLLLETITRSFSPFPIDPNRQRMNRNVAAYKALHAQLVKNHFGNAITRQQSPFAIRPA